MASKKLLFELIKLAKQEAKNQFEDLRNETSWNEMVKSGVYQQLVIRPGGPDYVVSGRGRYLGEPGTAEGIMWSNCEGEYKFWDKKELDTFMKVDGNPTAARALLLSMTGHHRISEEIDVWMAFSGIIDKGKLPRPRCNIKI